MEGTFPQLKNLVNDGANIIEIYACPSYFKDVSELNIIDIKWAKPDQSFHLENPQEEIQYHHRDMSYVFDTTNDTQKSYRRMLKRELFYRNLYITAFQEENIPSHCFPSTQDISTTARIVRHTQKINNRMHWIYEKDESENWITYIRYQHVPNIEITKMQKDLEKTIQRMPKPIQVTIKQS
jgi:histidinol phosphatase-like enzyme